MTNSKARVLVSAALLVFGAIFLLAGIFSPTNEIVVKLPLISLTTEVDRNGNFVITGTDADARWVEIGQGIVLMLIGYLSRPKHWEL